MVKKNGEIQLDTKKSGSLSMEIMPLT